MEIPVYFFTGFLDSGKTTFIESILRDPIFSEGEKTLMIVCEDGETEFDYGLLMESNCIVKAIEDQEDFNRMFLEECSRKYKPERVIVEWNGMWKLTDLAPDTFPKGWMIYQTVTTVDARTFDNYFQNMGGFMFPMLQATDMIVFNRCDAGTKDIIKNRRVRMINRRADIFMDYPDGRSEVYQESLEANLDLSKDIVDISDADYAMWYFDAMEHPEKYAGHTVRFLCQTYRPNGMGKNNFAAGRFVMTCCAEDISFAAVVCKHPSAAKLKDRDWYTITAEVKHEFFPEYQGMGPVLYVKSLEPAKKPDDDICYVK